MKRHCGISLSDYHTTGKPVFCKLLMFMEVGGTLWDFQSRRVIPIVIYKEKPHLRVYGQSDRCLVTVFQVVFLLEAVHFTKCTDCLLVSCRNVQRQAELVFKIKGLSYG